MQLEEDYLWMLIALAHLDNTDPFKIMADICEGRHWIAMDNFWITFDGLEDVNSPRSKAFILQ